MIEDFTGFQSCVDHFLGLLALFVRIILTHELSGYMDAGYISPPFSNCKVNRSAANVVTSVRSCFVKATA